jgi:GT2 family glycosyltransferase
MISYVLPTRDRPHVLERTLAALGALGPHEAEVIIIDNASQTPARVPSELSSGVPITLIRSETNLAAAARNLGAQRADPRSQWIVMLDDDSYPLDLGHVRVLEHQPAQVGAVAAEIFLPTHDGAIRHESGGLPEVFVGCGVALRTSAFNKLGGYDASFEYYAEEYDLSARLILAGYRVTLDRRFRVMHHKSAQGRDFSRIVRRLVRNNAWVAQRYAPDHVRHASVLEHIARYQQIAWRESATRGWAKGMLELATTLPRQRRREMNEDQWARFTGLASARDALQAAHRRSALGRTALVHPGKNARCVEQALQEMGIELVHPARAQTLVIATLSPGPMLDAHRQLVTANTGQRIELPWTIDAPAPAQFQAA